MFAAIQSRFIKLMVPLFLLAALFAPLVALNFAETNTQIIATLGLTGFMLAFVLVSFDFLAWLQRRRERQTQASTIVALAPLIHSIILEVINMGRPDVFQWAPEPSNAGAAAPLRGHLAIA